jgi:hypothetical protein
LATVGFLKDYVTTYFPSYEVFLRQYERPALDAEVYGDYASFLVPRAVGYSAGLLEYFFRGEIDLEPLGGNQYKIWNLSADDMQGDFYLYYDDTNGQRKNVKDNDEPLWSGTLASGSNASDTVNAPSDAKAAGVYMLVFRGKLGKLEGGTVVGEEDAVVGKLIVNYAFVTQDKVTVVDMPFETFDEDNGTLVDIGWLCNSCYVDEPEYEDCYHDKTMWEYERYSRNVGYDDIINRLTGSFVIYGHVASISAIGLPNVFKVNGVEIADKEWIPGDTTDNPTAWEIVGPYSGQNYSIEITFFDGSVRTHDLWSYKRLCSMRKKEVFHPDKCVSPGSSQTVSAYEKSIQNHVDLKMADNGQGYEVINIWGRVIDSSGQGGYVDYYVFENGELLYKNGDEVSWTSDHGDYWKLSTYFSSVDEYVGLDIALPLPFTADIKRVYTTEERQQIEDLGLTPIEYTIKFR